MSRRIADLLIDLDGTLVDPAEGIVGSLRYALAALEADVPETDDLLWTIGPPLRASFERLLGGPERVETAVRVYRERYAAWGLRRAAVYPGAAEALAALRADGARLRICTSKMTAFAEQVVAHFGLAEHFDGVHGAEADGRFDDKGELVGHLLEGLGLDPERTCMVGDRRHDVEAAARHGVPAIGALWGYGGEAELTAAGAAALCARPADLPRVSADLSR